jgi:hypothetical protein
MTANLSARFSAANEEIAAATLAESHCTDGLPIVVPTPERVERFLQHAPNLPPEASLGRIPPAGGELTVEKAAINAVMAGCVPPIFPLVIAVCEALADPDFDAGPMQNTTHPATSMTSPTESGQWGRVAERISRWGALFASC